MNLTEQYLSRPVRQLLGFPSRVLYCTPADAADYRRRSYACSLTKEFIKNQRELSAPASQIAASGLLHFRHLRTFC
jgi:hypothetical protein